MKLHYDCILCNINQVYKILALQETDDVVAKKVIKSVLRGLSEGDYSKTNSEIMSETWEIVTTMLGVVDPYRQIKKSVILWF